MTRPPILVHLAELAEGNRRGLIEMNKKEPQVFSLLGWVVVRVAQEMNRVEEWNNRPSSELVPLINLFCEVLEGRTGQRGSETKRVEHWVLRGLMVVLFLQVPHVAYG